MRLLPFRASGFLLSCIAVAGAISGLALARGNRDTTLTPIYAIQGNGDSTPLAGRNVALEGVVTGDFQRADQLSGFFVQDAGGDGDPTTSDGLFVYLPPRNRFARVDVKPGDRVRVAGLATEFKGQTQLDRVTEVAVLEPGEPPPPLDVEWPLPEGETPERLEGMLVRFPRTLTVSGNHGLDRYGELVLSAGGRLFNPTSGQGSSAASNARRRLVLDDASTRRNPAVIPHLRGDATRRVGDTVPGLTGILSYAFDVYRLQPTAPPAFESANPRPAKPQEVGGDIKVASFNVQNYFTTLRSQNPEARGAANAEEFARQSAKIVAALKTLNADVVGLIEIENNGATATNDLVAKLNAAYGAKTYAAVADPPQGAGTNPIKVAFIYKPARLELAGEAISEPGEIFDRPPVAQTFRARAPLSGAFTAVINHFKSKGSCPATGDVDTGQGCWNQKRVAQAGALAAFVETLKARDADVLVLGDLNAYSAEDPVNALKKAGLLSLEARLPVGERYSFVFDAQSGSLDHALVTPALDAQVTGIAKWHINADEPMFINYNFKPPKPAAESVDAAGANAAAAEAKAGGNDAGAGAAGKPDDKPDGKPADANNLASADKTGAAGKVMANPYRSSDHDPIIVGLRLRESATPQRAAAQPGASRRQIAAGKAT